MPTIDITTGPIAAIDDPKLRSFVAGSLPWFYHLYRAPTDHPEVAIAAFEAEALFLAPLGDSPSDDVQWVDPPRSGRGTRDILVPVSPDAKPDESLLHVVFERTSEAR